jgi:hypothetical protein
VQLPCGRCVQRPKVHPSTRQTWCSMQVCSSLCTLFFLHTKYLNLCAVSSNMSGSGRNASKEFATRCKPIVSLHWRQVFDSVIHHVQVLSLGYWRLHRKLSPGMDQQQPLSVPPRSSGEQLLELSPSQTKVHRKCNAHRDFEQAISAHECDALASVVAGLFLHSVPCWLSRHGRRRAGQGALASWTPLQRLPALCAGAWQVRQTFLL